MQDTGKKGPIRAEELKYVDNIERLDSKRGGKEELKLKSKRSTSKESKVINYSHIELSFIIRWITLTIR